MEESEEILEAINSKNGQYIHKEVEKSYIIFIFRIGKEERHFDIVDVIKTTIDKMKELHSDVLS